jgi:hypothetical protein
VAESQGGFNGGVKLGAQRLQESGEAFLLPEKVPVANIGEAIISASYQFDLWGTFKRGTEAAKANADAVQAAADTARITLVADVVKAYTQVCSANEEYHIARESLDLQEQSVTLNSSACVMPGVMKPRSPARRLSSIPARRTATFQSRARDRHVYPGGSVGQTVDQLPAGTADCAELPHLNQLVPVGDGAALLKRRPDVRQAERQLAAATASIGVATGALYPDISIGAQVGTIGILENLGEPATNRWGFGPQISWSIPTNGTRAHSHGRSFYPGSLGELRRGGAQRHSRNSDAPGAVQRLTDRRDALAEAEKSAKEAADQTHRYSRQGVSRSWRICRRRGLH